MRSNMRPWFLRLPNISQVLSLYLLAAGSNHVVVTAALPAGCSRHQPPHQQTSKCKQHLALQDVAQKLLEKCPLPGFCWREDSSVLPGPDRYLREPSDATMAGFRRRVADYIAGPDFQDRLKQRQQLPERGIQISAGKRQLVGNAAAIMHILRSHLNCTLPIEVVYQGDAEVDEVTRATLSAAFPPVYWLDLTAQVYPAHHNPNYTMDRYEPKIYGLYHTHFQKVLMLDADNHPLRDPSYLFDSPAMQHYGNLFWKDYWSPRLSSQGLVGQDTAYTLVGLDKAAYWDVMSDGQGFVDRDIESGELLIDRIRHADVLEYLWWLTSFSKELYKHVLGDKDTFGFAFAAAGKLHEMMFMPIPPGAAYKYKTENNEGQPPMWRFQAMTQYDHLGQLMFVHRTGAKWTDVRQLPEHLHVVTGPLPNRFIMSYVGNKTSGFQPDIPEHTLRPRHVDCIDSHKRFITANQDDTLWSYIAAPSLDIWFDNCPLEPYLDYLRLRDLGLPVSKQTKLLTQCRPAYMHLRHQGRFKPAALAAPGSGLEVSAINETAGGGHTGDHDHAGQKSQELSAGSAGRFQDLVPSKQKQAVAVWGPDSNSRVSLWPLLDEQVLYRNCRMLLNLSRDITTSSDASHNQHFLPHSRATSLQTHAANGSDAAMSAAAEPSSAAEPAGNYGIVDYHEDTVAGAKGLGPVLGGTDVTHRDNSSSSSSVSSTGSITGPHTALGVVLGEAAGTSCLSPDWHVYRYMLREYAEHVSVDSEGWVTADVDCQMPVLQLLQPKGREESSEEAARCLKQGSWSPVEDLQRQHIHISGDTSSGSMESL